MFIYIYIRSAITNKVIFHGDRFISFSARFYQKFLTVHLKFTMEAVIFTPYVLLYLFCSRFFTS